MSAMQEKHEGLVEAHTAAPLTIFKKIYPTDYFRRHLEERIREDGRSLDQFRSASLATGILSQPYGSALVRFGEGTLVTAAVHAEVAEPTLERPNEGFVIPNVELPALCSPQYKAGPPGDEAQIMTHYLQMFLNHSGILPCTSLCIETGSAVWVLHVDVVCISADGSVMDAAALAAVAALYDCRLPRVSRHMNSSQVICDTDATERLSLTCIPILTTISLYDWTYLLADATEFEQSLCAGSIQMGTLDDKPNGIFWTKVRGRCTAMQPHVLENESLIEWCERTTQNRAQQLRSLLLDALRA